MQNNVVFYNTINQKGLALKKETSRAVSQTELVLEVFKSHRKPMAYFEVMHHIGMIGIYEGSIKRVLSVLKSKGILRKTDQQVTSVWRKNSYRYELQQTT